MTLPHLVVARFISDLISMLCDTYDLLDMFRLSYANRSPSLHVDTDGYMINVPKS